MGGAVEALESVTIHPPVFIDPDAQVVNSTIGPYVSIGAGCKVENSTIRDSILEREAHIKDAHLSSSVIGERAVVEGLSGQFNIGDDSVVKSE